MNQYSTNLKKSKVESLSLNSFLMCLVGLYNNLLYYFFINGSFCFVVFFFFFTLFKYKLMEADWHIFRISNGP